MPADPALLALREVGHSFGGLSVLRSVTFDVPAGEIVGLIGPNGSGKTTLFNIVSGYIRPLVGSILYRGAPFGRETIQQRSHAGLVRTFQTPQVFEKMTVLENVMAGCCKLTRTSVLQDLSRAVVGKPSLLLLDEPSSGLNGQEIENLREWIVRLNADDGMTVLLVSHDMGLMTVANMVHTLYFGEIIASGDMAAIQRHPKVREVYLGV